MTTTIEENIARRLVERFSLSPPIDIESLASQYADVSSIEFPVNVDGVSLYLKSPNRRAEILINSNQAPKRWRFTLAHELGHVLILGHVGSIVDDIDLSRREQSRYREKEAEANRFAAELLMPTGWTVKFLGEPKNMALRVNQLAEAADVSVDAATLKVIKVGPAGWIVAKSRAGKIAWSSKTAGTKSNRPSTDEIATSDTVFPKTSYYTFLVSDGTYHWWQEKTELSVPSAPVKNWREILSEIVGSLPLKNPAKAKQSINGILAVANGSTRVKRSVEAVYAACLHNVRNRANDNADVRLILDHPQFDDFLVARVHDFNI